MRPIGYAHLIEHLKLPVRVPEQRAYASASVNRRVESRERLLFPEGVSVTDTPVGHLEFALRHEGIELAVIAAAFERIEPAALAARLRETPNGEYIRRACFLWEWWSGRSLEAGIGVSARYVDLYSAERYVTAQRPKRHAGYRVNDNGLGDRRFCPTLRREAHPGPDFLERLLARAVTFAESSRADGRYDRAVHYLYLSETRGSFAIEKEIPSADREERFVDILRRAGEQARVDEEWLVAIQNTVVRDAFSREPAYRARQNWLESANGRVTFLPHPPESLRETMAGWEAFVNDGERGIDLLTKVACASFGFVYIHPFMDGNGRLHRFIIHHLLARSGRVPPDMVIPVSAVLRKQIPDYLAVLNAFSVPVTRLWDYRRLDDGPAILHGPGAGPYRYFPADREAAFLAATLRRTVEEEIPRELAFLRGYDAAHERIEAEFDLPQRDVAALIRVIEANGGRLSANKRRRWDWLPDPVIARIETLVREAFVASEEPHG